MSSQVLALVLGRVRACERACVCDISLDRGEEAEVIGRLDLHRAVLCMGRDLRTDSEKSRFSRRIRVISLNR